MYCNWIASVDLQFDIWVVGQLVIAVPLGQLSLEDDYASVCGLEQACR